jgi:predicted PurR-regulated permease PerM
MAVPLSCTLPFTILLHPLVNFFCRKKVSRLFGAGTTVLPATVSFAALVISIISILRMFGRSMQLIDNNIIVPKNVVSKVQMNALVSLTVVLPGDALWGIPGIFLSIPLTAVAKVIFDRVEGLKRFGSLIADNQPEITNMIFIGRRVQVKKPV